MKQRAYDLQRRYGITPEDYERMLKEQHGHCAICHEPADTPTELNVDHCHETGVVRGLLCSNCNTGLGKFKDFTPFLTQAINYLERNNDGKS